jgi:phospholipid-translocating ATPase
MFNTMIPLSLYVSMEIIKICQMLLLNDVDMYDSETNTPFEARTSTINEELGQVGYIFSDKTGTLTENIMRFRKMSVAGAAWIHDAILHEQNTEEMLLMHKKRGSRSKGKEPVHLGRKSFSSSPLRSTTQEVDTSKRREESPFPQRQKSVSQWKASAMPELARATRSTQEMIRFIQQRPATHLAQKLKMMIISMAVCHTCLPERKGEKDEDVTFQASSPDELALVEAAKELGFIAFSRDISTLTLKLTPNGNSGDSVFETYEILDVIEFSSKRKRMSVLVRFPDGRFSVLCKGADSVIMSRLRQSNLANQVLTKIEQKVLSRKSMEAEVALRRKSSQFERKASMGHFPRTSVSLGQSNTPITRSSVTRLAATRDDVDEWLSERENDVPVTPTLQLPPRPSLALSERPLSVTELDIELAAIEETMTTDEAMELERCLQHVTDFATEGLRTLLYGYRFLDEQEYRSWKKIYHDATTSLVNRQMLIERAGELIEQQLELGGATAIEDKLQKGVPETIDRLRRANIKMWMLTGDKRETAINIGHSCGLIKDYSSLTVLDHETGNVEHNLAQSIVDINRGDIAHSVVVVDGQTLTNIEYDMSLLALFVDLAILADSVICCRASPSQKAGLVNAIRERVPGSVTLAIGDGANDIAMIQEAHVGIGITGKEGLQAARTSDYAIAQFRFLTKLLLVHGRWNYIRTCKYTLATFWKEFMFFITAAYFQHYTGYTGKFLAHQRACAQLASG